MSGIDVGLIENLGIIVCAAALVALLVKALRGPSIVAFIATGLLLGPVTGLVGVDHSVEVIAEFGIVLLLFLVGLELSLDKIKKVGTVALIAGGVQVGVTALGGYGLATWLGFATTEAVILSISLTFSSTVVVTKLLDQKGDLDTLYGRIAVGIFLVQDLVVVVALTVLAGLGEHGGGDLEDLELGVLAGDIGLAFGGMTLLLVLALAASKWLLPRPFEWAARRPDTLFVWSLCWCFLLVYASDVMGLSREIGAFLAGLALAQLPYNADLRRRVHPLMNFFIAIFFVGLGLQMELESALGNLPAALALSAFVLVGKFAIFMVVLPRMGYNEEVSFSTSVTVAQISEFGFIFATMALGIGLIGQEVLSLVALVGLVTIGISAYMIVYSDQLYRFVSRYNLLSIFGAPPGAMEREEPEFSDHVVVVGMNALGRNLVRSLCRRGETVVALDTDLDKLEGLPCRQFLGDAAYKKLLDDIGLQRAKLLVSTLHIEDTNRLLAYRGQQASVPTAIHAFDDSVIADLQEHGVERLIEPRRDGVEREWRDLDAMFSKTEGDGDV